MIYNTQAKNVLDFVVKSTKNWKHRFHNWSAHDEAVLDDILRRMDEFIFLVHDDVNDESVTWLLRQFELNFGLVLPFAWGTYTDVYFKNWHQLSSNYIFPEV